MTQRNTEIAAKTLTDTLTTLGIDVNGTVVEVTYKAIRGACALSWFDTDTMLDTLEAAGMVHTIRGTSQGDIVVVTGL
jgi:hypothetical protein